MMTKFTNDITFYSEKLRYIFFIFNFLIRNMISESEIPFRPEIPDDFVQGDEIPAESSRLETETRLKCVLEDCWSEDESSRPDFKSLKRVFR